MAGNDWFLVAQKLTMDGGPGARGDWGGTRGPGGAKEDVKGSGGAVGTERERSSHLFR